MQTKTSYGVVKWMLVAGMACSLASACVVSSGDGDDDDTPFDDGGDGGTNATTAGKSSGGGGSSSGGTAGSKSDGGTPGSTDDGGEPATGGGGTPSTFVPGECQVDEAITPTVEPMCVEASGDDDCMKCIKLQACEEYQVCFGEEPATACSVGMTEGADGQFDCIRKCFAEGAANAVDADELLLDCSATCDECGTGGVNDETTDLIIQANDPEKCQAECFPF
jgi:hypothetical protein